MDFFNIPFSTSIPVLKKKIYRAKIVLKIEASGVLISKGLELFQVRVEV